MVYNTMEKGGGKTPKDSNKGLHGAVKNHVCILKYKIYVDNFRL